MVGSRMNFESPSPAQSHGSLLVLAALALLVGTAAGALGPLSPISPRAHCKDCTP
jgi:hypothetical protein